MENIKAKFGVTICLGILVGYGANPPINSNKRRNIGGGVPPSMGKRGPAVGATETPAATPSDILYQILASSFDQEGRARWHKILKCTDINIWGLLNVEALLLLLVGSLIQPTSTPLCSNSPLFPLFAYSFQSDQAPMRLSKAIRESLPLDVIDTQLTSRPLSKRDRGFVLLHWRTTDPPISPPNFLSTMFAPFLLALHRLDARASSASLMASVDVTRVSYKSPARPSALSRFISLGHTYFPSPFSLLPYDGNHCCSMHSVLQCATVIMTMSARDRCRYVIDKLRQLQENTSKVVIFETSKHKHHVNDEISLINVILTARKTLVLLQYANSAEAAVLPTVITSYTRAYETSLAFREPFVRLPADTPARTTTTFTRGASCTETCISVCIDSTTFSLASAIA
ncbi:hypothetical protein CBL_03501 [Carabus blaptoides fortunei]